MKATLHVAHCKLHHTFLLLVSNWFITCIYILYVRMYTLTHSVHNYVSKCAGLIHHW